MHNLLFSWENCLYFNQNQKPWHLFNDQYKICFYPKASEIGSTLLSILHLTNGDDELAQKILRIDLRLKNDSYDGPNIIIYPNRKKIDAKKIIDKLYNRPYA